MLLLNNPYDTIMYKKTLTNDLVDYNLLLLRKIYDAYEDRADKVLTYFRTDKRLVLRKRYMVPILNPNYDYDKLLTDINLKGTYDSVEEQEVKMDAETLCEESDL